MGEHHFYVTFRTEAPGVRLSQTLREKYPEEMTIVLQHQFWDLNVTEHAFEVGLSFSGVPERLLVPFDALSGFVDPSVQFGLKFDLSEAGETPEEANAAPAKAGPRGAGSEPGEVRPKGAGLATIGAGAPKGSSGPGRPGREARRQAGREGPPPRRQEGRRGGQRRGREPGRVPQEELNFGGPNRRPGDCQMGETIAQPIPSAAERKHRARRFDEGPQAGRDPAETSLAIATIGIAVINPLAQRRLDLLADGGWTLLVAAFILHAMGQIVIRFLRPEE